MSQKIYDWSRYWYPRGDDTLGGINRLLPLHSYWWNNQVQQGFITLPELDADEIPCLILLGEAGMGKSHILKQASKTIQNTDDDRICFFDLADYSSTHQMEQDVFSDNPDFNAWKTGEFKLYLYLDSLDEAFIKTHKITERLTRFFQKLVTELTQWFQLNMPSVKADDEQDQTQSDQKQTTQLNTSFVEEDIQLKVQNKLKTLCFRIACRTGNWPLTLEDELKRLWGEDTVQVYILASLGLEDVREATRQNNLNFDQFWGEVTDKNVEAFASSPVMLKFLIEEFKESKHFPRTRHELYKLGCQFACRDENLVHESNFKSKPEERFIAVAKIAAMTIFTRHNSVLWRQYEDTEPGESLVSLKDIAGSRELLDNQDVFLYESFVTEALSISLFRGGAIRQWSQKTYAEFLAAWYVVNKLELSQIRSLIFLPNNRLIPQLEETAVWIAGYKHEVFDDILKYDPQILLRSDAALSDIQSKQKLTIALVEKCKVNAHLRYDRKRLHVLKHDGLPTILRPILENISLNEHVREFALDMAVECKEESLLEVFVEIALDDQQALPLRKRAASGIREIGNEYYKHQLKPLAFLSLENRFNGDLKWHGILANWPSNLSAQEIFDTLVIPDNELSLMDFYAFEDWGRLILTQLESSEISIALQWIAQQDRATNIGEQFGKFIDAILLTAWKNLTTLGIVEEFAKTIIALWQRHDDVFDRHGRRGTNKGDEDRLTREIVQNDHEKRLLLAKHLIIVAASYENLQHQFRYDIPLLDYHDVSWLITEFDNVDEPREKNLIVELIQWCIDVNQPEQFNYIYEIKIENPVLWQALNISLFIELDSDKAKNSKARYLQKLERERQHKQWEQQAIKPLISPSPLEKTRQEIINFEQGDVDAWWRMSNMIMTKPDGTHDRTHVHEYNFSALPVWNELDENEILEIIELAFQFIQLHEPDSAICDNDRWWVNHNLYFWRIVAGCRAFFLLATHDMDKLNEISIDDWQKWVPAFTYYIYRSLLFSNEEDKRDQKNAFLKLCKMVAPDEFTETILWIAECENGQNTFFLPSRIKDILDNQLAELFIREIEDGKFSLENSGQLLTVLADFDFEIVEVILTKWLEQHSQDNADTREKAIIASQLCLQYVADTKWELIWAAVQEDNEFGHQVFRRIVRDERFNPRIISKLHENNLADFYIWLFCQYPPKNDPPRIGFHTVTTEHEIADFRDSLLNELTGRGTPESLRLLKHIQDTIKKDLGYYVAQAEIIVCQNMWRALSPQELNKLLQDKTIRWIQDEKQLLDVIEGLLVQFGQELQGKGQYDSLPSVVDLWNEYPHGKIPKTNEIQRTPKDEERLSDYVARFLKRHLEGKNIFISREAEIRRGNKTDIHIETRLLVSEGNFGHPLTVIIEVKGCWNQGLDTALKEQLAYQYLKPLNLKHGIYLVGSFFCDTWSKTKDISRWNKSKSSSKKDLPKLFQTQVKELEAEGFDIRPCILNAKWIN